MTGSQKQPRHGGPLTRDPADAWARIALAGLFLALAVRIGEHVLATGRVTGLLLLASELLVVILTCARRPAHWVERSVLVRAIAGLSILGPMLLSPTTEAALAPEGYTTLLSAVGLGVIVAGKISIGRSFGLLPANRGVICTGLYRLVRHPIYLGYVITHVAFLTAHPTLWNTTMLAGGDGALVLRALYEERTLRHDPAYARYLARVRWRVLPGLL